MNNPSGQFISDSMVPFILCPDNTLNSEVEGSDEDCVEYDEEWEDGTIEEEEIIEEDDEEEIEKQQLLYPGMLQKKVIIAGAT